MTPAPRSSRHSRLAPDSPVNDHDGARPAPAAPGVESIDGAAGGVVSLSWAAPAPRFPPAQPLAALTNATAWSWLVVFEAWANQLAPASAVDRMAALVP